MDRPLRVLVDARVLVGRFSGIARVVTRLIDELARRDGIRVIALCGAHSPDALSTRHPIEVMESSFSRADRTPYRRWRWEQAHLPEAIRRAKADVYHATWNSGIARNSGIPCILTIHDLIPWDDPASHFSGLADEWWYRHAVRTSARRAACVTTVSEHVRQDVLGRLRLPLQKVVHVSNGVDIPTASQAALSSGLPYVLYVGGHERRKNLAGLFAAMQRYWERHGPTLELRLTGRADTLSQDAAEALLRLPGHAPVRFLGETDDSELERQYGSARALLLLSRAEGFGLPVLEAMAHQCPVIAAARYALPEVAGDAGILVDPGDPAQVCDAVFSVVHPSQFRDDLVARGRRRAAKLTWSAAADRFLQIYRSVCSPAPGVAKSPARAVFSEPPQEAGREPVHAT